MSRVENIFIKGNTSGNIAEVNDDGQLHVVLEGKIDTGNSTETLLGAGATFIGTSCNILPYSAITLLVHSDQNSATDGLVVEFSGDGIDWHDGEHYTVLANKTKFFTPPVQSAYYRIKYTNGATPQTEFHIHSVLKKSAVKWSGHNINEPITDQDDATLIKAVITGKRVDGVYDNVNLTNGNNMKISIEELENAISVNSNTQLKVTSFDSSGVETNLRINDPILTMAHGSNPLISDVTYVNKFGLAPDGAQTTATDIWDRANAAAVQQIWLAPTAARIHTLVSSSIEDDGTPEGAGTGAQAVRVWYLPDWDTKETYEDVIMNGTSGIAMNNAAVIIHRMKVIPVGTTYNTNTGNITATAATDGTVTAQINFGEGQTQMSIYGVPSIQSAYMTCKYFNSHDRANPGTVSEVDFYTLVNEEPKLNTTDFVKKGNTGAISSGTTGVSRCYNPYLKLQTPCIIKTQCIATGADIEASSEFDIILVDN